MQLSAAGARALHLAAQGLLTAPARVATRADVLAAIRRMQLLQIDTIHVVARSPYLVLFSRLQDYRQQWVDELLARRRIFEVWAHEACFAPIEDYPLHRKILETKNHWGMNRARRTLRAQRAKMLALLEHVRERGPVKAADFERPVRKKSGGWWGWKQEKKWLEAWFALGELMIARRENFHRVYDLRERVHPRAAEARLPSSDELKRALIERAVAALGVAQARWLDDYFRVKPRYRDADLDPLVADGALVRVSVEGWEAPGYVHRRHAALARRAARGQLEATHRTLLSPFDPIVWDRERARTMFDFDYRLECYTPEPKRRHGYFVLPILARGELVGRLDAKAHRSDGRFEIRSIHLEPDIVPDAVLIADVAEAIRACARWHATPRVVLRKSNPPTFGKKLRVALDGADASGTN
ncbi:MAG TPA: crosslink repair DNA glycosylase YcaQ family protein, partial [Polyangia bacterium]